MIFGDAGLVINPPGDYGHRAPSLRRDLRATFVRSPYNAVPEPEPDYAKWPPVTFNPNGRITDLSGALDDAVSALDRAGPRGAAALGAVAGVILSSNRILGGIVGGVLGYFGGQYFVNFAKKILAVQQAASTVASVASAASGGGK